MKEGWISLHRKIQDNPLWLSEPFTRGQAWVDLIILANHRGGYIRKDGYRIDLERGQLGWSTVRLAERWKWSRGKVNRFLKELKTDGQIEQQTDNRTSIITICNYEEYQSHDTASSTADNTADSTADGQLTDTRRYTNNNLINKDNKIEDQEKNSKKMRLDWKIQDNIYGDTIEIAKEQCQLYGEKLEELYFKFNSFIEFIPDKPDIAFITWLKRYCNNKQKNLQKNNVISKPVTETPKNKPQEGEFNFIKWNGIRLCMSGSLATSEAEKAYYKKYKEQGERERQEKRKKAS